MMVSHSRTSFDRKPVTTEPRHLHCLLSFFDPLLRCPPFVVKPYHRLTRKRQVRHNEPDSRVQLSQMMLYLRHHPSSRLPSGCLVQKSLVFDQRFLAGPLHRPSQQLLNVPLSKTGAEMLFEILSLRYERGATLVTSNLPFHEWTEVLGSERLTGALLDRLTHHVHILEMNGESYRLKESKRKRSAKPASR